MPKPVFLLIFQDCYNCGEAKAWHDEVTDAAIELGVLIKYTPHNTPGAKELILKAHSQGVEVPFLTDTKKFTHNLADLVEKSTASEPEKSSKKKEKKNVDTPKAK